jgi:NADH:ubiquinone oxidoreductase subunit 5 (subunit L)/multisubunit Na+/H+ antiporter MnhA subunit
VRNNAIFAFTSYQLSDLSMICALAFSGGDGGTHSIVAAGLIISALLKSSQFPMTALFARSMEG